MKYKDMKRAVENMEYGKLGNIVTEQAFIYEKKF